PRGCGMLVAYRTPDNGLTAVLPKTSIAIVDRRPVDPAKVMHKIVAFWIHNKGLKIRWLAKHERTGKLVGAIAGDRRRGLIIYRPERGDQILGRVIAMMREII
ncbi:MAG: hypothetical protein N3A66_11935, partial [Planctomycetota bacterium]|nr:hypothetical protein [Planctomycetota bacterium]